MNRCANCGRKIPSSETKYGIEFCKYCEKYENQIQILERALELACKEVPSPHCPDLPQPYNLQDEYGSDEPYYVYEGGCEFQDHCLECCINHFKQKAKKENE